MPLTIPAETLKRSFGLCQPFVPTRTTTDAMKYIRLHVTPGEAEMIATDGESSICHKLTGLSTDKYDGNLMLPAARFGQILHESTCEEFKLAGTDGSLIVSESGFEFQLQTIPAKEFPPTAVPTGDPDSSFAVASKALQTALGLTVFATDPDSTRYVLNSIRLETKGSELIAVATDSRRLSVVTVPTNGAGQLQFQLPGKDAKRIIAAAAGLADSAEIVIAKHGPQLTFAIGDSLIVTKEIAGRFPDWTKVMPKESKSPIYLPAGQFASVVRQAKLGMEEGQSAVQLRFTKGQLMAFAGEATKATKKDLLTASASQIKLPISYDGPEVTISFFPDYLTQWLSKVDAAENVEWHMTDDDSAVLMVSGPAKYVVMPQSRD